MKCYASQRDGGICVMRQGKVLTQDEYDNIHELPDREVCHHKQGRNCTFAGPLSAEEIQIFKDAHSGDPDKLDEFYHEPDEETVEIKVKDKNEPLDDGDIFDAFFK